VREQAEELINLGEERTVEFEKEVWSYHIREIETLVTEIVLWGDGSTICGRPAFLVTVSFM